MKVSTVLKPAMLFAAGSAASVAHAGPTIDTTVYNATPEGTPIFLANSGSAQYIFSSQTKPVFGIEAYFLNGQDGAQVTGTPYSTPEDAQGAPAFDFGNEAKTGSTDISSLIASDDYYGLRFSANSQNYVGFAGVINNGTTINQIGFQLAAAVPEPATWALMIAGFGGVGLAMRRRRRQAPAALSAVA